MKMYMWPRARILQPIYHFKDVRILVTKLAPEQVLSSCGCFNIVTFHMCPDTMAARVEQDLSELCAPCYVLGSFCLAGHV